jgi:hypothetical protein
VVRTTSNSPSYTSSKPKPSSTTSGGLGSSYKPSTSSSYRSFSTPSGMRSSSSSFSRRR